MTVEQCKKIARKAIRSIILTNRIPGIAGQSVDEVMTRLDANTDLFDGFYFEDDGSEFHGNQTEEEFVALLTETLTEGNY